MARKNQTALLKKLKKQVRSLQRKEERSRNQLKAALKKAHKLGRVYKSKLASKIRVMKNKMAASHASAYAQVAADVQRQMLKSVETRSKALKASIQKLEKKYISKLTRNIVNKVKQSGGVRKGTALRKTSKSLKKRRG